MIIMGLTEYKCSFRSPEDPASERAQTVATWDAKADQTADEDANERQADIAVKLDASITGMKSGRQAMDLGPNKP